MRRRRDRAVPSRLVRARSERVTGGTFGARR
jgi:hypothetical protein